MEHLHVSSHQSKIGRVYEKIARISLYLMVGLVPLVFLPWTVEPLEVNKQTFVLILASISVIAWLGMMVANKRFFIKRSWLYLVVLAAVIAVAISAAFSFAPFTSWVGQGKQEYTSFLSILAYALVFITGSHYLSETEVQRKVWSFSLGASAIVGSLALLGFFGLDLGTNLIGAPNAMGLYLATMAVLGAGLWLVANGKTAQPVLPQGAWGVIIRVCIFITVFTALIVLISLDFVALWVALIIGLVAIFTFSLLRAEEFAETGRFVLPMILFVAALIFLFMPTFLAGEYPVEISPSHKASWQISTATLSDTSWLVGSGPGTYVMDYAKHQPVQINQTTLWDARFDRASSNFLTMLPTLGVLGTLIFLIFALSLAAMSLKTLITERAHDEWKMTFIAFSGWLVLFVGFFLYSSNFVNSFLFWLLSGVLMSQIGPKAKEFAFSTSPRLGLLTTFMFVLVTMGLLTVMFVTGSRYAAEISFAQGVAKDNAGESLDEVLIELDTAARLNKLSDIYYRNLGNALLLKTGEVVQDPAVDPELVKTLVASSINASLRATELSPEYVVNWALLGDVYREVAPLVGGADEASIQAYQKAVELAPVNPKYHTVLGRAYLVLADQLDTLTASEDEEFAAQKELERDAAIDLAVESLARATELKQDYAPAHFYLALAYERQGDLSQAISRMEALRNTAPLDVGISFQLGMLYLRQGKLEEAQQELERTISIAPNYSNARWFLSSVYEQNGEFESAIEQVVKIQELNPDNTIVEQRLERLRSGQAAATIPEPLEEGETGEITEIEGEIITQPEEEVVETILSPGAETE